MVGFVWRAENDEASQRQKNAAHDRVTRRAYRSWVNFSLSLSLSLFRSWVTFSLSLSSPPPPSEKLGTPPHLFVLPWVKAVTRTCQYSTHDGKRWRAALHGQVRELETCPQSFFFVFFVPFFHVFFSWLLMLPRGLHVGPRKRPTACFVLTSNTQRCLFDRVESESHTCPWNIWLPFICWAWFSTPNQKRIRRTRTTISEESPHSQ